MSRKVKPYCLDFDVKKKESKSFSFSTIQSKFSGTVKTSIELLLILGITAFCLYKFYYETTEQQFNQLTYITFLITCINAVLDTRIFRDESFYELKLLMDYAQEVLPLPFLTADLWMKNEMAPGYVCYLHAAFGLFAFFYMIVFECKRLDLTDLSMFVNFIALMYFSVQIKNVFSFLAAVVMGVFYLRFKRYATSFEDNRFYFMCCCALFNLLALMSFNPDSWSIGGGEKAEE